MLFWHNVSNISSHVQSHTCVTYDNTIFREVEHVVNLASLILGLSIGVSIFTNNIEKLVCKIEIVYIVVLECILQINLFSVGTKTKRFHE